VVHTPHITYSGIYFSTIVNTSAWSVIKPKFLRVPYQVFTKNYLKATLTLGSANFFGHFRHRSILWS